MTRPTTRPFHLHFNTPDVPAAERRLANLGLPLRNRFGLIDGESVALGPEDAIPDGFKLRLQDHQRGYVNVTVAPGRRPHFDHLGLCTADFDAIVARVEEAGWSIRDPAGRRPFVMTPWGFRVEVHRDGSDVEAGLGDWDDAHVAGILLAAPDPTAVRDGLESVFGAVPGLRVENSDGERAWVSGFEIDGADFPKGLDVESSAVFE